VRHLIVKLGARGNSFGFKLIERFYKFPIRAALLPTPFGFSEADCFVLNAAARRRMTLKSSQSECVEEQLL
jgi:hypothetical protein